LLQIDGATPEEKAERMPLVFPLSYLLEGNIGIQGLWNSLPFLIFPTWNEAADLESVFIV
jgi:hypothetical protein